MGPNNIRLHKSNGIYLIKDQYKRDTFLKMLMKMLIIIMILMLIK